MDLPYISFFTTARLNLLWQNIGVIFLLGAPLLLIVLGTELGGQFLRMLKDVFSRVFSPADDADDYDDD